MARRPVPHPEDSCLIEKLGFYISLGARERAILAEMEKDEREYRRGDPILRPGHTNEDVLVVKNGWLFTATTLADGRRQLLGLHFPGDVLGLSEMPLVQSPHEVQAVTDCRLCPFPKAGMETVFRRSPRLAALFFSFAVIEQLVLLDRIRALGRMSARERLAHFLLEIRSRLRIADRQTDRTFRMPLTQGHIADALGLTNVYVSKSLARLRDDGLIAVSEGSVTIEDEQALREMCDFEDRYRTMDVSWFPAPNAG